MNKFFQSSAVVVILSVIVFGGFILGLNGALNRPVVAYDGTTDKVVYVELDGKKFPSFEAAGLDPNCRHDAIYVAPQWMRE
jgi:hypothetical protein